MPDIDLSRLDAYTELLRDRAVPLGLISARDAERVRERHVEDSLRALSCLRSARNIADVGSGSGLPGIPVAIARPDLAMTLIEPRRVRAGFLELCVESLRLRNVKVFAVRAEDVDLRFEASLVRAVADAPRSWEIASPLLTPRGHVVYFAGASWGPREEAAVRALGLRVESCSPPSFPWQGPLVTMGRDLPPLGGQRNADR